MLSKKNHTGCDAASDVPLLRGAAGGLLAAPDMGLQVGPPHSCHGQDHRRKEGGRTNTATLPVEYGGGDARHRMPALD
jgi:hypothetical protein